jgi:archaellum biogenesis ATPase FlaH
MDLIESQTRQFVRLLGHDGKYSQMHCHNTNTNKLVSRELVYGEEKVIEWAKEFNGRGNLFIGRAPRQSDGSCVESKVLSLDIDPQRQKGEASTQAQWEEAIQAGRSVVRSLSYGILCSSGNGALVLFPLRERMPKEDVERLGKSLEDIATSLVKGSKVNVDATWDCPRLAKLVGSTSTKGDTNLWRQARFIDSPISGDAGYGQFMARLNTSQRDTAAPSAANTFSIPDVAKGELDRSKADISLANRLKIQGFTAEDAYKSLVLHATRAGREDDYRRIIQKVYFDKGNISELVQGGLDGKELQLWTPVNGLTEYRSRSSPGTPELPTGFKELDRATFGLVRGHIYTVGARTNGGKTTFSITVAAHLCGLSKRVLYVSTETQYAEIWDRYIAVSTGVSAFKIQHGLMSPTDTACVNVFIEQFKEHQFFVYDGSRPNLFTLKQAIEQTKPDVVVLDYFQHAEGREVRELEDLVMGLKDMAKERSIALLVCAQLHDGYPNPKTGKVPPPAMRDIKNCKVLNDESRTVVLLDWDRDAAVGDGAAAVKIILAKNKGPKTDVVLKLDRSVPRFQDE